MPSYKDVTPMSDEEMLNLKIVTMPYVVKADGHITKKILRLIKKIEQLQADLRGKDNEIEILKWRVNYLEQFKPKENIVNQYGENNTHIDHVDTLNL